MVVPIAFATPLRVIAAENATPLPEPPGLRVTTLPRAPGDKPQESAVAVNPLEPRQVIVSFHQAVKDGSDHHPYVPVHARVAASSDGGVSWVLAQGTTHRNYRRSLDATVAFDRHGHAFLIYLGMDEIDMKTRHGEFVNRSLDGGRTWQAASTALIERPESRTPVLNHMPNIVADNHSGSLHAGNIYAMWDRQIVDTEKKTPALKKSEILISRSTDDGGSWSAPKVIFEYSGVVVHAPAVGSDGTLYIMYSLDHEDSREIIMASSRDGGDSFGTPLPVTTTPVKTRQPLKDFPRSGGWPVMAMDPRGKDGRLFVVWGDDRDGDRDVFCIASDDRGRTWSAPVRVNDDPPSNGKDQIMEWLAVDPTDGAAYVVFYDRRGDENNKLVTVTLARSVDGGRTFINYALSNTASDPTIATLGDYIGVAAAGGRVYAAWPENASEPQRMAPVWRPPSSVQAGAKPVDDKKRPWGSTVMRVGVADFRATVTEKD